MNSMERRGNSPLFVWILVWSSMEVAIASEYSVAIDYSVMVEMSDGVSLSTDVYFPVGHTGTLPAILIRTPYNKEENAEQAKFFATNGFVVLVQDLRGKFESGGEFEQMSPHDARDGHTTISWIVDQSWSNGKVGTYGCSYLSEVQGSLAALRHPNHRAAIMQAGGGVYGENYTWFGQYEGGVVELAGAFRWHYYNGHTIRFAPQRQLNREDYLLVRDYFRTGPLLPEPDYREVLWSLPVVDIPDKAKMLPSGFERFITEPVGSDYWQTRGYVSADDKFDIPILHVDGWYDGSIEEHLRLANLVARNSISEVGRDNQFIIVNPGTHCEFLDVADAQPARTVVGSRQLGDARFDYTETYLSWFRYWLEGKGSLDWPKVRYYTMGENAWKNVELWPPQSTSSKLYLTSDEGSNSVHGDGRLTWVVPEVDSNDSYIYDPGNPVPTYGGTLCCTGEIGPAGKPGAQEQSPVEVRNDVLVYSTSPLEEPVEVTGYIEVILFVSSSARDTDFTAKLVDVYPDGRAYNIQSGITRARYRNGFATEKPLEAGEIVRIAINLHATSNRFEVGHRIRLQVSISDFPRFERNLNTGGKNFNEHQWERAANLVHHGPSYPSHVVLPLVE